VIPADDLQQASSRRTISQPLLRRRFVPSDFIHAICRCKRGGFLKSYQRLSIAVKCELRDCEIQQGQETLRKLIGYPFKALFSGHVIIRSVRFEGWK
jgi:hypothetical protein